jgi:hypothetical protein
MKAKDFWISLCEQIEANREDLESAWTDLPSFTSAMTNVISRAIKSRQASDKHVVQPEYFNIDLTKWEQKKSADNEYISSPSQLKQYHLKKYAWDLNIAVEHENDKDLWMDEVVKLAHIFCDLRVVIGYFPYVRDEGLKWAIQQSYLDNVAETINTLKCRENMDHGEFMIILGDVGNKNNQGFKPLVYTPYLYCDGRFAKQNY